MPFQINNLIIKQLYANSVLYQQFWIKTGFKTLAETCFCQDGLNRFKPRFKPLLAETCQPWYCHMHWEVFDLKSTCIQLWNSCWNSVYQNIFGLKSWKSERELIIGLDRMKFEFLYYKKCLSGVIWSTLPIVLLLRLWNFSRTRQSVLNSVTLQVYLCMIINLKSVLKLKFTTAVYCVLCVLLCACVAMLHVSSCNFFFDLILSAF